MVICDPRLLFGKIIEYDRKKIHLTNPAFTIVELLVVIVVIGILAAITIVSYTGITSRAVVSALQSDLTNASSQLKLYQIDHSAYPTSLNASNCPLDSSGVVDSTYCIKPTSGNTFLYSSNNNSNPQTFSLYAINTSTNTKYRTTDSSSPTVATPVVATGGTITNIAGYKIHTFTTSGTFTVTSGDNVEVLVVGGGGSGGTSVGGLGGGGGGGGGGLIHNSYYTITPQAYSVTIGNGGSSVATSSTRGNNGGNSALGTLNAVGGGGGGKGDGSGDPGAVGGSGGGAGYKGYTYLAGSLGTSGQGNKGGDTLNNNNGGGGGGAGGVGGDTYDCRPLGTCTLGSGGLGGLGLVYSISSTSVTYAKGGEGGAPPNGFANGAANTGNGGSGVYAAGGSGAGGSGIVVIRYPL